MSNKICDVYFRESLYSCCRSSVGLEQLQARMAAHKVRQPFPACSPLMYWKWTDKLKGHSFNTACCQPQKFRLHYETLTGKFFFKIVGQLWFPKKSRFVISSTIPLYLLLPLFLSVNIGTSNAFYLSFKSHFLTSNSLCGIRLFHFVPQFTLSLVHPQRRIQGH